jgi:predicted FMN-binding regulatory protein PaiB
MLTLLNDNEIRSKIATQIMNEIIPALDREYNRIREEEAMTPEEFDQKTNRIIASIRVRISQIKAELKTARGKRKQQLEKMLEIKQAEYDNFKV